MAREEKILALLEQGRIDAMRTEAARQERYKGEDAERVRVRAEEDKAYAQGDLDREAVKAEMQASIAARGLTPEAQVATLSAQVAHLTEVVEAAKVAAPVTPPAPAPVV